MSGNKVIVIHLLPVGADDEFGIRILTLKSDSDTLEIGRASKRESKNLFPRADNALFDSRVMSRNHAKVRVVFDRKEIYLRDGVSTHGTWLNGEKLAIGKDYPIVNGDLVAFGTEVIRGRDSFRPLQFRFEYQWKEPSVESVPVPRMIEQPSNTFCVPDNEDESDEYEMEVDDALEDDTGLESDNSGLNSDSEDIPIDLDSEQERQPLVTPRMTPPSNNGIAPANNEEQKDVHREILLQQMPPTTNQESPIPELVEVVTHHYEVVSEDDSDEQSESSYSEESVFESSDSDNDPITLHAYSQFETGMPVETEASHLPSLQGVCSPHEINDQGLTAHKSNPYPNTYTAPTSAVAMPPSGGAVSQEDPLASLTIPNAMLDRRATTPPPPTPPLHLPSPSQLLGHSLDVFRPTSLSSMASASSHPVGFRTCPTPTSLLPVPWRRCDLPSVYTDGPFVNDQPSYVAPHDVTMGPGMGAREESTRERCVVPLEVLPSTRPNICSSSDSSSLKRKAEVLDSPSMSLPETWGHSDKQSYVSDDEEVSIPDAQPQVLMHVNDSQPESQLGDKIESVKESLVEGGAQDAAAPLAERPAKRLRTSEPSSFRTHATTAVVGAVVGAVGTIALLASLPADYFL